MDKPLPIMPLEAAASVQSDSQLLDPAHFDNEEHVPTRMAIDLLEAVRYRVRPCSETADWYENALTRWATGEDIEVAFGLTPSIRKPLRHKIQTGHLRAAFAEVVCDKPGIKASAEYLADEIQRFESKYGENMPAAPLPNWSRLRRCVWRARKFGNLPRTWENIAKRIKR